MWFEISKKVMDVKVDRCPRCGMPGYLVLERKELKSGEQVYYFVVHRFKQGDRWATRKCAVGSEGYVYVSKTHDLPYHGVSLRFSNVVEEDRLANLALQAVRNIKRYLARLEKTSPEKYAEKLEKLSPVLQLLAEEVNGLASKVQALPKFRNKSADGEKP